MPYVIFGHSHLLSDIFEIVHQNGDRVRSVVQNVPEEPSNRLSVAQRLALLSYKVELQHLNGFSPDDDDKYVIGFTGQQMESLVNHLDERFGGIGFDPIVHPTAIVADNVDIHDGAIINAGAIIAPNAEIGKHCFINRGATIGHDAEIGAYSFVSPGANVAGHVKIGRNVMVGTGANIIPDKVIGESAIIGAGAVVITDVEPRSLMVGVPAKRKDAPER
jgi:sugar O-acyltransferase (sialic acid O-acetyltransferase NeuD family)